VQAVLSAPCTVAFMECLQSSERRMRLRLDRASDDAPLRALL